MADCGEQLRGGVRALLQISLAKSLPPPKDTGALVARLEKACFEAAGEGPDHRRRYAATYGGLCRALPKKYGKFLEATLAAQVADGRVAPGAAATPEVYQAHEATDPRRVGRALFYGALAKDPRFDSPGDAVRRDFAERIERACYNAAISRCEESEDSYCRQWDSPMFCAVYSARCGEVVANIDPQGSVADACRRRGSAEEAGWALDHLAAKTWTPEALGGMSAAELCPFASRAEREAVMCRLDQKVAEKTSSLFACPRCHKRNHTYRQVQIGSGDEPSTFMCTCKECGENYEGFA